MLKEFKEFVMRGNVVDLAVGIIIGVAFISIVNSLVEDIIMPPIGLLLGGVNFSDLFIPLDGGQYQSLAEAQAAGAPVIAYGQFINTLISFLIVAFAIFLIVRVINRLRSGEPVDKATEEPTTKECPYCISTIPIKAIRCPQCTSDLTAVPSRPSTQVGT